jgi:hypothetical protein
MMMKEEEEKEKQKPSMWKSRKYIFKANIIHKGSKMETSLVFQTPSQDWISLGEKWVPK